MKRNKRCFGKFDTVNLGRESNIKRIIEEIGNVEEYDITLDIRGCNIDYPATAILIDKMIDCFPNNEQVKQFQIIYDIDFSEIILLQYLLVGSVYFNVPSKKNGIDDYKRELNAGLCQKNIALEISIQEIDDTQICTYKYGTNKL